MRPRSGFVELGGDKHIDVGDEVCRARPCLRMFVTPSPLSVTVSSVWQPAGMDTVFSPSNVSMGQIVAKHGPAHRHLNPAVQVVAIAGELLIRLDADVDVQSPAAPPPSPTSPWLANRRRALSLMPAGTVTPTVRVVRTRPWPMQLGHGFWMMVPWPSQRSQGAEVIIWPSMVRTTFCMNPCPWQSGQVTGCAPPWAPEPPHSWHRENVLILTCAVPPNTAVFKSMDAEAKASAAGLGTRHRAL